MPRDWLDPDGWVERCLDQVTLVEWPVIVVHDVVGAAMPRLPELLDRLDERGATYTQETPDSCTPLRAGRSHGRVRTARGARVMLLARAAPTRRAHRTRELACD